MHCPSCKCKNIEKFNGRWCKCKCKCFTFKKCYTTCYMPNTIRHLPIPYLQLQSYNVHIHCIYDHIQISYTLFAQVLTNDLIKASQCLCHQTTTPFVSKYCVTFCCIFNKIIKKSQSWFFWGFKTWSNEANKQIMCNVIQKFIQ